MAKKNTKKKENTVQNTKIRPPIITIMGHVDHGKTSILDAIRESQITTTESGGITQHIGAYSVEKDGKKLTFIDTPGHEAFTQMRARGGQAADIVILVVAADDGVMPQTKEAIMHTKAAEVPVIVAINKCDLPAADVDKVKRELAENGVMVEGYGGDVVAVEVSAIEKTGLDQLLEVISLIAEIDESKLKADPEGNLEALIVESKHTPKRGIAVSVVIKNGTLKVRDQIITGGREARVRSLIDVYGKQIKEATLGDAVEVTGFSEIPQVGDLIYRIGEKQEESKEQATSSAPGKDIREEAEEEQGLKKLNLVIRADTAGTIEAIVASINKLKVEDAKPNILFSGTGEVKESDVLLASTARAIIMAFKVRVPGSIYDLAENKKVIVREHEIIYKLIEEIEAALEGVLEIEEAKIKGRGFVIKTFNLPKSGDIVVGTLVEAGKFKAGNRIGVYREGEDSETPLYVSKIRSVHIGPKEVDQAAKGSEAGLLLRPQIEDIQLDDKIEVL